MREEGLNFAPLNLAIEDLGSLELELELPLGERRLPSAPSVQGCHPRGSIHEKKSGGAHGAEL